MTGYKSSAAKYGTIAIILAILVIGLSAIEPGLLARNNQSSASSSSSASSDNLMTSGSSSQSSYSVTSTSLVVTSQVTSTATKSVSTSTSTTEVSTVQTISNSGSTTTASLSTSAQTGGPSTTASSSSSSTRTTSSQSSSSISSSTSSISTASSSQSSSSSSVESGVIASLKIHVGNTEFGYDSINKTIYVSTMNASIAEINGTSNALIANLTFSCGTPSNLAFDSKDEILYALFLNNDPQDCRAAIPVLIGINATTNKIISDTRGFNSVAAIAYDQNDNLLLIEGSNSTSNQNAVLLLNASSPHQVGEIVLPNLGVGAFSFGPILFDPSNDFAYFEWGVAGANNLAYEGSIANVSSGSLVGSFEPVSSDMHASQLSLNSQTGEVYVAQSGAGGCSGIGHCTYSAGGNLTILSGKQTAAELVVSKNENSTLGSIAYNQASNEIFVSNSTIEFSSGSNPTLPTISVLSAQTGNLLGTITENSPVSNLFADPAEPQGATWIYVATPSTLDVVSV